MHQDVPPTHTSQHSYQNQTPNNTLHQQTYTYQYNQQYQPQPYLRPPRQFTPVQPPLFDHTDPHFQYQPSNTTYSQPASTINTTYTQPTQNFTPDDVYYPTFQHPRSETYPPPPQPPHSFQQFLLTDEQLMQMPDFNIDDLLDEQPGPSSRPTNPPTTHHHEDMSSDSSESTRNERLGRGHRQRRIPRCGTRGHIR
ncbi:unnamed protein product [Lathyrus sativus]|nr:unnamed protein product [Lathyrus sativus]